YHGVRALVTLILLTVTGVSGAVTLASLRASALVDTLADADINSVPRIIKDLAPYRRWAEPLLVSLTADNAERGRRLRASLALLPSDPGQLEYLYSELLKAPPEEWLV